MLAFIALAAVVLLPNSAYSFLDRVPVKLTIIAFGLVVLAAAIWLRTMIGIVPTTARLVLNAWRASVALSVAVVIHPAALLSLHQLKVQSLGVDVTFDEVVGPTTFTFLAAAGVIFCFTVLYMAVRE